MRRHTPGPWIAEGHHVYHSDGGGHVGLAEPAHMSRDADARLMAAAPELLEACESVAHLCEIYKDTPHLDGLVANALKQMLVNARRAIAKATE